MFDLRLMNGIIVDSSHSYPADIYVRDGKIAVISENGEEYPAAEVVDVAGLLLFPGAIDVHMHIGEYEADFEEMDTSTAAAAIGGITCCIDMPLNLKSPSVINSEIFKEKRAHLEECSYVDFCMWGALTADNLNQLKSMHETGAASFKSFMTGAGSDFTAPSLMKVRKALQEITAFGGMAGFHCEDYSIIKKESEKLIRNKLNSRQAFLNSRPLTAELIAVKDVIELARETKAKVHICHVSHPAVARIIGEAQKEGIDVSAETCVHYLTLTEQDFLENGCLYKCAPPLRDSKAKEELWGYVENGVLSCVASDHSPGMPWDRDDTNRPIYEVGNGISGVQTMFQTYFDAAMKRGCEPTMIAKTLAEGPARRWGLYGKKGAIKVGFDADLVAVDPIREWKVTAEALYYKQKISAFINKTGTGMPVATWLRGKLLAKDGQILGEKGGGRFIAGGIGFR